MGILPNYLKRTDTIIYNENAKHDIKLTILGDLHISKIVPLQVLDSLKYQLEKTHAQYHCLLGDLIDVPSDLKDEKIARQLFDFIKSSASIAPTVIVLGSHDFIDLDFQDHFDYDFWQEVSNLKSVYLLNNSFYNASDILFMGYFQPYYYWYPCGNHVGQDKREDLENMYQDLLGMKNLYTSLLENVPKICLMHSPEFYKDERIISMLKEYDFILCGHYHNGMLPIFFDDIYFGNQGLISPKREKIPKLSRGMVTLSTGTKLFINGGIMKVQYSASPKLWPYNSICYEHIDTVTLTGDETFIEPSITRKRIYVGRKGTE